MSLFNRRHLWETGAEEGALGGPLPPLQRQPQTSWGRTRSLRRKLWSWAMGILAFACVIVALIPLIDILGTAIARGGPYISWSFLVGKVAAPCTLNDPLVPNCSVGGIGPIIFGTLLLIGLASLIAIPVGILTAIYLNEYGKGRFGRTVSFLVDVMSGVPALVLSVFVAAIFLEYDNYCDFGLIPGTIAISFLMLPIVTRTAEDSLRYVPDSLREAGHALGVPKHKVVRRVVLRTAAGPLATGSILAVMRGGGDAAVILFVLGYSLTYPTAWCGNSSVPGALPLFLYFNSFSAFTNQIAAAWGAALVLIMLMLGLSLVARVALVRQRARYA